MTHQEMMEDSFALHVPPNRSKLEPWRDQIEQMRAAYWPFHKIARWLEQEKHCRVHKDTIRKFCLVRQIEKGGRSSTKVAPSKNLPPPESSSRSYSDQPSPAPRENQLFSYGTEHSERPIEIKRRS